MYIKLFDEILNLDKNIPFYNYISISNICNANCKFCDVHEKKEINTSINVINLLNDLSNSGAKYVHFTGGGEPLANNEINKYFEFATLLGLNIVFITNGFFLTDEQIDKLGNYNIKAIFFSVDSHISRVHDETRSVKGLFEKATNAINKIKLKYPNIKIIINHVLNQENILYLNEFIKMSNKIKYDYLNPIIIKECPEFYFTNDQIEEYNKSINKIKDLLQQTNIELLYDDINYFEKNKYLSDGSDLRKDDIKCQVLNFCTFIDCVTGNVYPCDCSVHRDYDYYCIGNIKENSIIEIFNSKKAKSLRKELIGYSKCKSKCDYANMYLNKYLNEK